MSEVLFILWQHSNVLIIMQQLQGYSLNPFKTIKNANDN